MCRAIGVWAVAITMTIWCGLRPLHAQEATKSAPEENKAKAEQPERPMHAYRIDFSIGELEDGKKINTRHYALDLNSGNWSRTPRSSASSRNEATTSNLMCGATSAISRVPASCTAHSRSSGRSLSMAAPLPPLGN